MMFYLGDMEAPGGNSGGMPNFGDGQSCSYSYHGDPRATFSQFFGSSNPFQSFQEEWVETWEGLKKWIFIKCLEGLVEAISGKKKFLLISKKLEQDVIRK